MELCSHHLGFHSDSVTLLAKLIKKNSEKSDTFVGDVYVSSDLRVRVERSSCRLLLCFHVLRSNS